MSPKKLSEAEIKKLLSDELKRIGSKGGKARARKLTPEERSAIARKAASARWKKK